MGKEAIYISKDNLIQLYEIDGLSCRKIGKIFSCCHAHVLKLLKSYNIQARKGHILVDMIGKRYGRLLVLKREESDKFNGIKWLCKCDCGNEKIVSGNHLRSGHTKSCGCLSAETKSSYKKGMTYIRPNSWITINCVICGKERTAKKSSIGKHPICGSKKCLSELRSRLMKEENNPKWLNRMVGYDDSVIHFKDIEDIRRSPSDPRILEVRCLYCNKWFQPTQSQVSSRKIAIVYGVGGNRFYCSDGCKTACPIFKRRKYPKGFRKATSREVDPDLRKLVLERDDWQCQKCGSEYSLHVHHIEGYAQNLMLANDMDNCITMCKICHKWVHTLEGCNYFELRCGPSPIIEPTTSS